MRSMAIILRYMIVDQRQALLRGALLSVVVLLMGAALLGLSGWFITAAAAAGLVGAGAVFDVFRPSAMVRFLALGRTAARYGERLQTHDATLRALASVRVRLLGSLVRAPYERLQRVRAAQALNRITADVDALDGVPLRLVLPVMAALATHVVVFFVLWRLVDLRVAAWVACGYVVGGALVLALGTRAARGASRWAEVAAQAFRTRLIDLIGGRADLAVYGQLVRQAEAVSAAEERRRAQVMSLDFIERVAGAALAMTGAVVTGGALWIGGGMAARGEVSPASAAIGVFVALALAETIAPLRRVLSDQGRIVQAARRVAGMLEAPATVGGGYGGAAGGMAFSGVTYRRVSGGRAVLDGVSLTLEPGTVTAVSGPSGTGKSTLLLIGAGLLEAERGSVTLGGCRVADWEESAFRAAVTLVPQRAGLLQGTVAENLRLAAPEAGEDALWEALEAVRLDGVIRAKGGLEAMLGPRGSGLSGGEARRLVLARALLRRPEVLLLDEPTEGIDGETSAEVLAGMRSALPGAAILIATHKEAEMSFANKRFALKDGCLVKCE
ncbi:thiol reductant ABC exporter subunit CydC [Pseudoruegeria sp. HB172150]|uniref:thiol reductant ABC exporter subunit CydC n=1 Tax=Pseudoruegeria sp. HB172150 TaxID=2721164 RepID=UPI001553B217|nr:thiol reductant ABC exporter subunit CydC [Pseudoruegeria sp. HB172150]